MKKLSKKNFLSLLKQAVMFYPKHEDNLSCYRLNSFVYLENAEQVKKENFGLTADNKGKDYFFVRGGGHDVKYPALFIWEQGVVSDNVFGAKSEVIKECSTFQIAVLDVKIDNCKKCNDCQKRTVHEIKCDANVLLLNALNYFLDVCCVTIQDTNEEIWAHKKILEQMVAANEITGYTIDKQATKLLQSKLKEAGQNVQSNYYSSYTKNNLHGVYKILTMCFTDCPPCDFCFEDKGYKEEILNCC